jgi:methyl-accepting chemotaxis protein
MRKKFLIKPALQLKHLAWTVGVAAVAFIACYALFERQVSHVLERGALDQATWLVVRANLRVGFSIALGVLLIGVGLENYFFFHTIAGPIYALEKGIKRLAAGDFENVIHIRAHDELSDVIHLFEDMKKKLLLRIDAHEQIAQLLTQELDRLLLNASQENIDVLKKRLQEIRSTVERQAA